MAWAGAVTPALSNATDEAITPVRVAQGLANPWAVAFLPDGRFLVTERKGNLRVVEANGTVGPPLAGLPRISAGGQGGLLDVVLDTGFERNRTLYFCFSEAGDGGSSTALARAELAADATRLDKVKVIFSQQPKVASTLHFGCRITQTAPDVLFLTLGERFNRAEDAQTLDNHHGKVVRIHTDGRVPADNPFVKQAGALPEIWSLGHRNPQGAALAPDGRLWIHEHGPRGGDEINLPAPGANFGWPQVSFGTHYSGLSVGSGKSALPGLVAPVHQWTPSIAPSGMAFVTSQRYGPGWQGNLVVGSLKFTHLARLELDGTRVVREHKLLADRGQRIRDVRQGPDGLLYVLTDSSNGELLRLVPR
ncbi:MAG TPA: PQQ-dependent sugar dehydrogenase [Burkholderiaceae bacterium]|nr:PQQ-dependent sugar dehydrogenase [Burkholderiaceae bacterium]